MNPERCVCGHFPVMHAGGRGRCNHGPHSKTETGCDCVGFRAQTVIDTNDVGFATQEPAADQGTLLGVVNDDASEDYA